MTSTIVSLIISASTALHPGTKPVPDSFTQVPKLVMPVSVIQPLQAAPIEEKPLYTIPDDSPVIEPTSVSSDNTYEPGQCVWYIKNLRPELPNTWHDASNWFRAAQADGWATGYIPRVNAVGVSLGGDHVVLVTAVNPDGTFVTTEMNQHFVAFQITSRVLSPAGWGFIY